MKNTKYLRVQQVRGALRRQSWQALCLRGLGLTKHNRERVLEDNPTVRGLIASIPHLVRFTEEDSRHASQ